MTLNLTYLKYFYDAARLGSLTASAKENFVTQSAVSQGIMKLEHYFRISLLTHRRNIIKLTPEGRTLFESSKKIFRCVDDINDVFISGQNSYSGLLEFSCYNSVAVSLLPRPLAIFQNLAPKVTPNFYTGRPEFVLNWLKLGKVEMCILSDQHDLSPYDREPIHKGYFRVYESIHRSPDELVERCIFTEPKPEVYSLKNSYQKYYSKELSTHMEVTSWEVIVNLILSNVGAGLIPDYLAQVPYRAPLLRLSKLQYEPFPYVLYAVYPKGEELSKNSQLFLKCFKEVYAENV